MATTKSAKIEAEIEKVKAKIAEQQTKLKELEQRKVEAENSEIVDIVRGMSIPLAELPLVLQQLRAGKTLGQNVPKSGERANAGTRRRNGAGSLFGENGKGKMEGTHEREPI